MLQSEQFGSHFVRPHENVGHAADNLLQSSPSHFQIVSCGYFLGECQIVAGLGLISVHNSCSTYLEIALRQLQLLPDSLFLSFRNLYVYLGGQYVEVGLSHAQYQVLRRQYEL